MQQTQHQVAGRDSVAVATLVLTAINTAALLGMLLLIAVS